MKKLIFLSILQLFFLTNLSAQQTNDLRGVRYYYSTPTIGNFTSLPENLYRGYRPYYIFEKGDQYIIGGGQFVGNWRAGVVSIDKWNDSISWDWTTQYNQFSRIHSMIDLPGEKFIAAWSGFFGVGFGQTGCATNTVVFNLDGSSTEQMLPEGRFEEITQFTKVSPTLNSYNNRNNSGTQDPPMPVVDLIDNDGNYVYSKNLPYAPTFNNLPVSWARAIASFKYYDAIVTFGDQSRMLTEPVPNMAISYSFCPALWVWGTDDIFYSRELYENYPNYSSDLSINYHYEAIVKVVANQNEYVIATNGVAEQTPGSNNYVVKNFLTCLDTNLQIKNMREVRSNTSLKMRWFVTDLVWDTVHNQLLVTGIMQRFTNIYHDTLVSEINFIARCYANGMPIYYKYFYYDTEFEDTDLHLAICENGDLLFTGEGYNANGVHFFTYRTDPDGYHPDGQYVGIQEVLVSPTEIGIFPNPSDGLFEISSMSDEKITITILDEQGKLTMSSELSNPSDNSTFDLRSQPPGVYFAHISQGEQQWVKKLVVR